MSAMKQYIVKQARAENRELPWLFEVLRDCPEGYRLHSVVPHAAGAGYTSHFVVIFEMLPPHNQTTEAN